MHGLETGAVGCQEIANNAVNNYHASAGRPNRLTRAKTIEKDRKKDKRKLRRYALFCRIDAKKPHLIPKQIKSRLQWCQRHLKSNSTQWESVIFSDECKLELHPNRRVFIQRTIGEISEIREPTFYFFQSLMVWVAPKTDGGSAQNQAHY